MATRKDVFSEGEFYHIYNRGNTKQNIFLDENDRDRFVKLLYLCNSNRGINFREDIIKQKIDAWDFDRGDSIVSIGAWVLMSNHFHLYTTGCQRATLWQEGENPVSLFMNKLSTAYSMYFNKKYSRNGSLFEGRFKSVHIENDEQAKYLFSYIHLNPIKLIQEDWREFGIKNKNKAIEFLDKYKWSSYHDYRGVKRLESRIISREAFPDYFESKKLFDDEIFSWMNI